jgi:hypothetical protein
MTESVKITHTSQNWRHVSSFKAGHTGLTGQQICTQIGQRVANWTGKSNARDHDPAVVHFRICHRAAGPVDSVQYSARKLTFSRGWQRRLAAVKDVGKQCDTHQMPGLPGAGMLLLPVVKITDGTDIHADDVLRSILLERLTVGCRRLFCLGRACIGNGNGNGTGTVRVFRSILAG